MKENPYRSKFDCHVLHVNVNGLKLKRTEIQQYLAETKPDVVCFNETKLFGATAPAFAGYRLACLRDRQVALLQGGGVAIYVRGEVTCSDVSPDMDDVAAVEVTCGRGKLAIVSYYCRPGHDTTLDVPMLEGFAARYDQLIIAGDLNAKHQYFGSKDTDMRGELLFDMVERNDMFVANDPTQITRHVVATGYGNLIDYFIVSKALVGKLAECYVGEDVSSDHLPVHLKLQTGGGIHCAPTRQVRVLTKCDWKIFAGLLVPIAPRITAQPVGSAAEIDERCELLEKSVQHALDTACPLSTIKDYAFRVSPDTLELIRLKRKLRRKSQRDPLLYRTAYNYVSRQVDTAITAERRRAWERATESLNSADGSKFWRKFLNLTGVNSAKARRNPRLQLATGELTDDTAKVSELFATSLENVHKVHDGPEFCVATRQTVERYVRENTHSLTPLFPTVAENLDDTPLVDTIGVDEVKGALRLCKSQSAPGPDSIKYTVLKKVPDEILAALATLFSLCLAHGYFPNRWKEAHGVMIAKPGKDQKLWSSYRPISLLSTIGKLFERIIARRLSEHLSDISFINKYQCAYQTGKESTEILYRICEEMDIARGKGWVPTVVSLDVEKAFDSVWHDGLRHKLGSIGLPVKLCRLLSSFITDRTVAVKVGASISHPVRLEAGTPQGSVLSPLLYLIYVNDLPIRPTDNCRAGQFADDMNVWTSSRTHHQTRVRLSKALGEIERWCSKWRIKLNVAKTQLVPFTTSQKWGNLGLKLFGQDIQCQNSLKVLGVTFNRCMRTSAHCRLKAAAAMRKTNLLRVVSGRNWGANQRTLLKLYKQYVRPVMEYGSVATSTRSGSGALHRMELVERKAMRIALRAPFRTRIAELYGATGLVPLLERLDGLRRRTVDRLQGRPCVQELDLLRTLLARDERNGRRGRVT